jgi:hypothetical protein
MNIHRSQLILGSPADPMGLGSCPNDLFFSNNRMSGESNVAIFEYSGKWMVKSEIGIVNPCFFPNFRQLGFPEDWKFSQPQRTKDKQRRGHADKQWTHWMRPNSAAAKKQAKTETTAAEKNKNQCRRWRLASCVPCTTAVRTESDAPTTVLADRASQLLTETRQHPPRNHQQQRRQTAQDPGHAARFSSIFICFGDLRALPKINVISEDAFGGFKSEVCKPSENGGTA